MLVLSCVERDRATTKAPWKPVLYKLALYRGMPVHTVTFSRIHVYRCRTPCKFVVGRDPLSKSTVRVKKSSSLIVLARAGCFPPLSPGILVCRVSCVCHNLPAVRHSVSWKRPPLNLHRSQSYVAVSHVPWKVVLFVLHVASHTFTLTILFHSSSPYFVQQRWYQTTHSCKRVNAVSICILNSNGA